MSAVASAAILSAVACGGDQPGPSGTAPAAGIENPAHVAIQGAYGVYVTNEVSGDLSVIDPTTNRTVATLPLGKRPRGIRVAPDHTRLYIALSGSPISPPGTDESTLAPPDRAADGIGVVDVETLSLGTILRGPQDPEQTSVSRDGTRLYVANEDKATASVLEIASGKTIAEFQVGGEPEGVTTSPDGRFVYVTSEEDNQVSVIDTDANRVIKQFRVGPRPRDSAFLPDGSRAYVTSETGASISVVDTKSHTVIETIRLTGEGVRPMGAVVSPDGQRLYVSTGRGGTVVAIDTKANKPVGSVAVGTRPWGLALSPDGARLYTANGPSNDVAVVDTGTLTVLARVPVGQSPWGVAIVSRYPGTGRIAPKLRSSTMTRWKRVGRGLLSTEEVRSSEIDNLVTASVQHGFRHVQRKAAHLFELQGRRHDQLLGMDADIDQRRSIVSPAPPRLTPGPPRRFVQPFVLPWLEATADLDRWRIVVFGIAVRPDSSGRILQRTFEFCRAARELALLDMMPRIRSA